jgi:hypothetical protein
MFRTSHVNHQEDYIVHTALHDMFFHAFIQALWFKRYCVAVFIALRHWRLLPFILFDI